MIFHINFTFRIVFVKLCPNRNIKTYFKKKKLRSSSTSAHHFLTTPAPWVAVYMNNLEIVCNAFCLHKYYRTLARFQQRQKFGPMWNTPIMPLRPLVTCRESFIITLLPLHYCLAWLNSDWGLEFSTARKAKQDRVLIISPCRLLSRDN